MLRSRKRIMLSCGVFHEHALRLSYYVGRAAPTKPKSMLVTTSLAINSNFISLHFPELILIRTSMLQRDSLVSHTATRSSEKPKVSRYQKCIMINNPVSSYLGAHTKQNANNTARRHQHIIVIEQMDCVPVILNAINLFGNQSFTRAIKKSVEIFRFAWCNQESRKRQSRWISHTGGAHSQKQLLFHFFVGAERTLRQVNEFRSNLSFINNFVGLGHGGWRPTKNQVASETAAACRDRHTRTHSQNI